MKLSKDLEPLKQRARTVTNNAALERRQKVETPGAAYDLKVEEAKAVAAALDPDEVSPIDMPVLHAEAAVRGMSVPDLAQIVLAKAVEARRAVLMIEIERQRRLAAIAAARSPAEIHAVTAEPWND